MSTEPWNLNIHYHQVILDAAPLKPGRALDVGSGDGLLAFDLADHGFDVIGIDPDAPSVERASAEPRGDSTVTFICGNLFTYPFEAASFDLVASSAMLHHIDAHDGLLRMKELVRPGGVIALVGFAQPSNLKDHTLAIAGAALTRLRKTRGRYWEHNAPIVWPPPLTTSEMAELAATVLPGSSFRPLMSNRYSLVWHSPS